VLEEEELKLTEIELELLELLELEDEELELDELEDELDDCEAELEELELELFEIEVDEVELTEIDELDDDVVPGLIMIFHPLDLIGVGVGVSSFLTIVGVVPSPDFHGFGTTSFFLVHGFGPV